MTGQAAHRNGLIGLVNRGWELPGTVPTVVDHFNRAGYETVLAGLQHERRRRSGLRYQRDLSIRPDGSERIEGILIEHGVAAVQELLRRRRPGDPPFFLNLGSWETHAPWSRPEYRAFRPDPDAVVVPPFLPDHDLVRGQLADFLAAVAYLDHHIGALLDTLEEVGLAEDTLVAFTTDHGIAFPRAKSTLYEPGLQTALVLRWPGHFPSGRVCRERIPNLDLLPTYCEAAGAPSPEGIDGRSFWKLATGETGYTPREAVFAERNFHDNFDPQRSVTKGRFKYIRNFAERRARSHPKDMDWMREAPDLWRDFVDVGRPLEQLFDLEADPHEMHNLAGAPECSDRVGEMRALLYGWMEETDDFLRGTRETILWPGEDSDPELAPPSNC
jgi:arylsulfatase A-like enzyme